MIKQDTVVTSSTNRSRPVNIEQIYTKVGGAGRPVSVDQVELPQPYSQFSPDSSSDFLTLQLISEQYMVELHSPPGRYTLTSYLADYVNTIITQIRPGFRL